MSPADRTPKRTRRTTQLSVTRQVLSWDPTAAQPSWVGFSVKKWLEHLWGGVKRKVTSPSAVLLYFHTHGMPLVWSKCLVGTYCYIILIKAWTFFHNPGQPSCFYFINLQSNAAGGCSLKAVKRWAYTCFNLWHSIFLHITPVLLLHYNWIQVTKQRSPNPASRLQFWSNLTGALFCNFNFYDFVFRIVLNDSLSLSFAPVLISAFSVIVLRPRGISL